MSEEQLKTLLEKLSELEHMYLYKSDNTRMKGTASYYQGKYAGVHKAIEMIKKAQAGQRLV